MSASSRDINLTVIAGGVTAHYASVKGCGNLIWDLRFGLYEEATPDPHSVLDFAISSEEWGHCLLKLEASLSDPIYGSVTVDFDRRCVIDDNGYGSSDQMFPQWLHRSILDAIEGRSGAQIDPDSLKSHLQNGRIKLVPIPNIPNRSEIALPSDLHEAATVIEPLRWEGYWATLAMPEGWSIRCEG